MSRVLKQRVEQEIKLALRVGKKHSPYEEINGLNVTSKVKLHSWKTNLSVKTFL
jgi:hypothetical protein